MTLQEFITTNPLEYGEGNGSILYSSSLSGSTPVAPYYIIGVTLPYTSKNDIYVEPILRTVDSIRFSFTSGSIIANITGKQKRSGYYYFNVTPFATNYLPVTVDTQNINIYDDSEFIFTPYTTIGFNNSDYNPLINNSEGSKLSSKVRKVDRSGDAANPTNIQAILSQSATFAEIQNCSYTKVGLINSRYNGSKATAAGPIPREYNKSLFTTKVNNGAIPGNEPAINLITFQGSRHASDADTTAIKAILNADRTVEDILFNVQLSGSHPNKSYPSFPKSGSFIYGVTGGRTFKLTSQKIYSIDTDQVFTTNNLGGVTLVE